MSQSKRVRKTVLFALFIGIEVVLIMTPLGFLPIGPITATTLHIPVILISILLGIKEGMILGFVFGLSSMLMSTFNPSLFSFCFSPFYSIGEVNGNFYSLLIAFVPRIAIGFVSGSLFILLKDKMSENISILLSALIGTLTNTILVMGGIYLFFGHEYAQISGFAYETFMNVIKVTICTNGVMETILACVIALPVYRALKHQKGSL